MIIKNPCYNNWSATGTKEQMEFIKKVNFGDDVIHTKWGSTEMGQIKLISQRGINVSTPWGDKFVKWKHVKEIHKTN